MVQFNKEAGVTDDRPGDANDAKPRGRDLPPAALRALAEAEARRRAAAGDPARRATEIGGPKGPEPTRYGDWESKGRAIDF